MNENFTSFLPVPILLARGGVDCASYLFGLWIFGGYVPWETRIFIWRARSNLAIIETLSLGTHKNASSFDRSSVSAKGQSIFIYLQDLLGNDGPVVFFSNQLSPKIPHALC